MTDRPRRFTINLPWRGLAIRFRSQLQNNRRQTIGGVLSLLIALIPAGAPVWADSFDDQIAALRAQVATQQAQAAQFHAQASDAQSRVAQLRAQSSALQAQINLNQAKYNKISADIAANEVKLDQQKKVLAASVKSMYLRSNITPIEILVSSGSLSDFLDQQQYRDKIKSKIQATMAEVQTLQAQLTTQQAQVSQILADQKGQQQQLAAMAAEANQLLALASQNAVAADAQVQAGNGQIASLKAQQQAILLARYGNNISGGGACGGGYPGYLCNAPQDTIVDPWGMYNKECVSYTAFKVAASGRRMPYFGGRGNANQWPDSARRFGIPVDDTPHPGDVAISMAGPYGHAMYVESVGGGSIHVSQYNYGKPGTYSEMTIPSGGLYYIHFR